MPNVIGAASRTEPSGFLLNVPTVAGSGPVGVYAFVALNSGTEDTIGLDWSGSAAGPYPMVQRRDQNDEDPPKGFFGQRVTVFTIDDADITGDTIPVDGTTLQITGIGAAGAAVAVAVDEFGSWGALRSASGSGSPAEVASVSASVDDLVIGSIIGSNPGTITATTGAIEAGTVQADWTGSQGTATLVHTADASPETTSFGASNAWGVWSIAASPAVVATPTVDDPGPQQVQRGYASTIDGTVSDWTDEVVSIDAEPAGFVFTDNADGTWELEHDGSASITDGSPLTPTVSVAGGNSVDLSIEVLAEPTDSGVTNQAGIVVFTLYEGPGMVTGQEISGEVTMDNGGGPITVPFTYTSP